MSASSPSAGGGVLIALGALTGAGIGLVFGEATPGVLIGTAVGIAAATAIWWRSRRR